MVYNLVATIYIYFNRVYWLYKMRWKAPKYQDERIKSRFLILPQLINDEFRWLEKAAWVEEYNNSYPNGHWVPKYWINNGMEKTDREIEKEKNIEDAVNIAEKIRGYRIMDEKDIDIISIALIMLNRQIKK